MLILSSCFHWYSYESGILEDPDTEAPKDMYQMTTDPQKAPDEPDVLVLDFKKGTT